MALLGACTAQHPKATRPSAPPAIASNPAGASVDELAAAVAKDAQLSDAQSDAQVRERLAAHAQAQAQACLQIAPRSAACLYYRGVALGLEARAHPLHANDLLKSMLEALSAAQAIDPGYDQAGPERVKALVLVRAPGWPLGPGDVDAGLTEARRAVQLQPDHPPNQLALAEALSRSGDASAARAAYQRAYDLALAARASTDRDDWLKEAERGLGR